ncbi:MAG: ABC transporter permease [Candidatus Izemoplasmatales bacterium]|nr:ABC transporter permease [bacterium]MDZ4196952.1 ABC transporter permease [Candidatus Izemoplasmatales bacterium]
MSVHNYDSDKELFRFTRTDERIFDTQFETKPIGYFKDAISRFRKNKASVFAFFILLIIITLSIVGPNLNGFDIKYIDSSLSYLPPKSNTLAKVGIMTGYKTYPGVPYATLERRYDLSSIIWMSEPYEQVSISGSKETIRTVVDIVLDEYQERFKPQELYISGGAALANMQSSPYYITHELLKEEIFTRFNPATQQWIIRDTSTYLVTVSYLGYYYADLVERGYSFTNTDQNPSFWFGTDGSGQDLFTHVWTGARTSLLIGFYVMIVTVSVGVVWGSISGYYGGTVDLLMERFTEILNGVPWLVAMTLIKLYFEDVPFFKTNPIFLIALALVITSWIGTSRSVRAQFYRYKGREYVLASRTLGAPDRRLIFKHILPNAIGPIITASVLIVPSAIFTESAIAFLNLGPSGTIISIGTLLSNGQSVLLSSPHMVLFPAIIISLLMISFNLFGNGLRDAFNPSLRGVE